MGPRHLLRRCTRLLIAFSLPLAAPATALDCRSGEGTVVVEEDNGSFLCTPEGTGDFPAVLYNHGGLGLAVGGDLEGTCRALAGAGYLASVPLRADPPGKSLPAHQQEVLDAFDDLHGRTDVDPDRVAVMGFSRGGLLSLGVALARPGTVAATILMAPAPGNGYLEHLLEDVSPIAAPLLIQVAANDTVSADHVFYASQVASALQAESKTYTHTLLDAYPFPDCTVCDGHDVFQLVDDEFTDYWCEVRDFLALPLAEAPGVPAVSGRGRLFAAALLAGAGGLALRRRLAST